MRKKITAALTAIVLTITSATATPFTSYSAALSAGTEKELTGIQGSASATPGTIPGGLKGYEGSQNNDSAKLKEQVTVIVELNNLPLLDRYLDSNSLMRSSTSSSFEEFSQSAEADTISSDLLKQQDTVINQISLKKLYSSSTPQVLYRYTTVMNGFAIRTNYGAIENIKKIPGVKTAYEAPKYDKIDPVMDSSTNTIGASSLWDLNYKGQKTAVAIIDTGLDTSHPGFQTMPSEPKFADSSVLQARINSSASALQSNITDASTTFVNTKVPYAYDYADGDLDVIPSEASVVENGNDHGTHVAGTVAAPEGDTDNITGVAPEAQLMIMKVFSDIIGNTGAYTDDILAALEDAVVLGADVINMSLGSPSGFTDEGEASISAVYARVENAGITMAVSAGNSYSSVYNNGFSDLTPNGLALSDNPDTAVVGSPSTYFAPLSVASVVNTSYHAFYFEAEGNKITYTETAAGNQPLFSSLSTVSGGAIEYVAVPYTGMDEDYSGIDVSGKIALVNRGAISFNDKLIFAKNHGAIGLIVANNVAGTISMAITNYDIPAVSITLEDGNLLQNAAEKVVKISSEAGQFPDSHGNEPSDFSSWGVTPDLKLKPEIAAPGENIYSTLPDGKYGSMSGTSMASPHIAGAYALMKQYLNQKTEYFLTSPQKAEIATDLLMSTAVPSLTEEGIPYSPRKQGSGIVNIYNAVNAGAYLYTDKEDGANGRPKLNLGDDVSKYGSFTKSFHVRSITGSAISYTPKAVVMTESLTSTQYGDFITESPLDISDYTSVSLSVNGSQVVSGSAIVLYPEDDLTIDVTISLSEEIKQLLDASYQNGEFLDGYITLVSAGVDLSIPFMGFYGDWTKAPLFDSGSANDLQGYQQTIHTLYTQTPGGYSYLGVNPFDENAYELIGFYNPYLYAGYYQYYAPCADLDKIAISPNGDGYFDYLDTAAFSLLRNARSLNYELVDEHGNVLLSDALSYESKTQYISSEKAIVPSYFTLLYGGTDTAGTLLPNNSVVNLTVSGELDFTAHEQNNARSSLEFPVTIDLEAPKLLEVDSADDTLELALQDNQYAAALMLFDKADPETPISVILIDEDAKNSKTDIQINKEELGLIDVPLSELTVVIFDYAMNSSIYDLSDYTVTPTTGPTDTVTPDPDITTSPSASPEPSGTGEPTAQPTTIPTAPTQAPTAVPTQAPTLAPTVIPTPTPTKAPDYSKSASVTISNSSLYPSETATVTVKLSNKVTKKDSVKITYSSSEKNVAVVDSKGTVTAKSPGTAVINVKVNINGNSSAYKINLKVKKPSISFSKKTSLIKIGKTYAFKAKTYGIKEDIIYTVSKESIASIDAKTGTVKALKPGTVYVIAKAGTFVAKWKLTVK